MKRSLFLLPALLFAGAASAQVTDAFDVRVGDIGLLQLKEVQTDVGITGAQRTKMNAAAAAHDKRMQDYQKQLKALGATQMDRAKVVGFLKILKKDVFAVLTPLEGKRLRELTLQRLGLVSLTDESVASRVGLTPTQIGSLRKAFEAGKAKFEAMQATARNAALPITAQYKGRNPKTQAEAAALQKEVAGKLKPIQARFMPKLVAIGKETDVKMLAVLTAPQKAKWTALKGKPFVKK